MRGSLLVPFAVAISCAFAACSDDRTEGALDGNLDAGAEVGQSVPSAPDAAASHPCATCIDAGIDGMTDAHTVHPRDDAAVVFRPDSGVSPRDTATFDGGNDAAADHAVDAGFTPSGYPDGPYGTDVGETLPYLRWQGYVAENLDGGLASDGPFTPYSSDDVHRSGKRLALLHVADFDCPGCNHAATVLAAGARAVEEDGALVVEVLGSEQFTNPADRTHLDAWIRAYDLTFTTVIDAPGHDLTTLGDIGIRETALVVDPPTMKIVFRMTGDLAGIGPSSLDSAFTYVHDHIGQ